MHDHHDQSRYSQVLVHALHAVETAKNGLKNAETARENQALAHGSQCRRCRAMLRALTVP